MTNAPATNASNSVMRALVLGSALCLTALTAAFYLATPADAARPSIARDMCNQTSGNPMGYQCPTSDHLLIRPKYSDGTCGNWICCPPNGDGTYDCTRATSPTGLQINNRLRQVMGSRVTVATQGQTPRRPKRPAAAPAREASPD